jgi:hypothetical protein
MMGFLLGAMMFSGSTTTMSMGGNYFIKVGGCISDKVGLLNISTISRISNSHTYKGFSGKIDVKRVELKTVDGHYYYLCNTSLEELIANYKKKLKELKNKKKKDVSIKTREELIEHYDPQILGN